MNEALIQTLEVLLLRISCQFVIEFLLNLFQSSRIVIVETESLSQCACT
jgi:hypothetical protein